MNSSFDFPSRHLASRFPALAVALVIACLLGFAGQARGQDTDGDGIDDADEVSGRLNPWKIDPTTGISTFRENYDPTSGDHGEDTNPNLSDSDGDGLTDGEEIKGTNNPWLNGLYRANFDPTAVGATPGDSTNPRNPDTDGDSLEDGKEIHGTKNPWKGKSLQAPTPDSDPPSFPPGDSTDPTNSDSDGDGLSDGAEVEGKLILDWVDDGDRLMSNPLCEDTDEDTLDDKWEVDNYLDPSDNGTDHLGTSDPNDGDVVNGPDGDPDGDGLTNRMEYTADPRTDPQEKNSTELVENFDNPSPGTGKIFAETLGGIKDDLAAACVVKSVDIGSVNNTVYYAGEHVGELRFPAATGLAIPPLPAPAANTGERGFIAAQSTSGQFFWAKQLSAAGKLIVTSIEEDGTFLYVTGSYSGGPLSYDGALLAECPDPTPSETDGEAKFPIQAGAGFILKLDAKDEGSFLWAKSLGNLTAGPAEPGKPADPENKDDQFHSGSSIINDVAIYRGNVYVCGDFSGNINLFGTAVSPLDLGTNNEIDFFAAKLNSEGDLEWSNTGGGPRAKDDGDFGSMEDSAKAIAVDETGDAYVVGRTRGTTDHPAYFSNRDETSGLENDRAKSTTLIQSGYERYYNSDSLSNRTRWRGPATWFIAKLDNDPQNNPKNIDPVNLPAAGECIAVNNEIHNRGGDGKFFSEANDLIIDSLEVLVVGRYHGSLQQTLDRYKADDKVGSNLGTGSGDTDGWIMRLNSDLDFEDLQGVHGDGNASIDNISAYDGQLYVSGGFGKAVAWFQKENPTSTSSGKRLRTGSDSDLFLGKLSSSSSGDDTQASALSWSWVQRTTRGTPVSGITARGIAINNDGTRLYMTGSWGGAQNILSIGSSQGSATFTAGVPASSFFYAVKPEDGTFFQKVTLDIRSPVAGNWVDPPVGEVSVFSGTFVSVTVPARVYEAPDPDGPDAPLPAPPDVRFKQLEEDNGMVAPSYTTRHTCIGYSLGDGIIADAGTRFEGTIVKDTILEFNWETDYALDIASDIGGTLAVLNDDGDYEPGALGFGLTSTAAGNPDPEVRRHWLAKGEITSAFIDGVVVDVKNIGTRYVTTGFVGTGAAPSTRDFTTGQNRQQINAFSMTGPASITYQWGIQHRVQASSSNSLAENLPQVRVDAAVAPAVGTNGFGSGEHWFNRGAAVLVGSLQSGGGKQLTGWATASVGATPGSLFPMDSQPSSLAGLTQAGEFYYRPIVMNSAVTVAWNYGDTIYRVAVDLGSPLNLKVAKSDAGTPIGAADIEVANILQQPARVRLLDSPPGSTVEQMQTWDAVANLPVPLRPGKYFLEWDQGGDPNSLNKTVIEVSTSFPGEGHFTHLYYPGIPNVNLDPEPADKVAFLELAYSNGDASATEGSFQSTLDGMAVLLFSRSDTPTATGGAARGDRNRETLHVRVVETTVWDEQSTVTGNVTIGKRIDGGIHDRAQIGTGFVPYPLARYNASLHDRTKVADAGPIFPVNLHFEADEMDSEGVALNPPVNRHDLVVFWYQTDKKDDPTDELKYPILWPYTSVKYDPSWPAELTASSAAPEIDGDYIRRIVIASRLGSEGAERFPYGSGGTYRDQLSFSAARFEQVAIYQQPDPSRPGFNPNEEHALIAPSFRYLNQANAPSTAYALRRDLNVTTRDPSYTSDPYVLVQFLDREAGEYRMAIYGIDYEDRMVPTPVDDLDDENPDNDRSFPYFFEYPMLAGEPVQPPYPLGLVIGFTPCEQTFGENFNDFRRTYWEDYKGQPWAVSDGRFAANFYYPLAIDFWGGAGATAQAPGTCVPFLTPKRSGGNTPGVTYVVTWPEKTPVLKAGESLTFPGGEYKADHPDAPGLPGVIGWAAGTVAFDSRNPSMSHVFSSDYDGGSPYSARIIAPLETLVVEEGIGTTLREQIAPASGITRVDRTIWRFTGLSPSLQRRVFYDPLDDNLKIKGYVNDKTLGDAALTAPPAPVYVLEPNILTAAERDELLKLEGLSSSPQWRTAVDALFAAGRDANNIWSDFNTVTPLPSGKYFTGLARDTRGGGKLQGREIQVAAASPSLDGAYFLIYHPAGSAWVWFELPSDQATGKVTALGGGGTFISGALTGEISGDFSHDVVFTSGNLRGRRFHMENHDGNSFTLDLAGGGTLSSQGLAAGSDFAVVISGQRADNLLPPGIAASFPTIKVAGLTENSDAAEVATAVAAAIDGAGPLSIVVDYGAVLDESSSAIIVTRIVSPTLSEPTAPRDGNTGFLFPVSSHPDLDTTLPVEKTVVPATFKGPGLALVPSPEILDPDSVPPPALENYVTIVENNDPDVGGPISVFVIKVSKEHRYRGAIKTIFSDNVFDEKVTVRHTGDFGGNTDDIVYQWFYREEDGTESPLPPHAAWKVFADTSSEVVKGKGQYQVTLDGTGGQMLADNLFFVRYRHENDKPAEGVNSIKWGPADSLDGPPFTPIAAQKPLAFTEWWEYGKRTAADEKGELFAGAGNSPTVDGEYKPQLVPGWIKRVLDRINPYEARFNDFRNNEAPSTYVSMIRQAGTPYVGPVALNPDKNVIENVGLIELYHTIFDRGTALSIDLSSPINTPGINNALLLASSRLSDLYMLLGNEAYSDAQDPTIGFGSNSADYGYAAPSIFSFQNQMASLLDEELSLLRGVDESFARPVFNRLFWNFTKSEGEAAYALNYNISDQDLDGFIDETDAMILYPQGHGDAWGHYLSALRQHYDLLRHPFFNWVSRSEQYNLLDIVIKVDFEDERKFANAAAAKARAGAEIVNQTYRSRYVADPDGQWQGYTDPDESRGWGVQGWARRAGQGAYFDWVTANAILPDEDSAHAGIVNEALRKIDRKTVTALSQISAYHGKIQGTYDDANGGLNPLGLADEVVPFDLDPVFDEVGSTIQGELHFDQIYKRAIAAAENALRIFDHANEQQNRVRQQQVSADDFFDDVLEQDRDYRNGLIEIFGTPYQGTIGTGKVYPAGYHGPDLQLFMYADVNEFSNRTVPANSGTFKAAFATFSSSVAKIDGSYRNVKFPYFVNDVLDPANFSVQSLQNLITTTPIAADGNVHADIPVKANDYTFQAPPEWGRRAAPGELQSIISEMLQAEADYASALSNYDNYVKELVDMTEMLQAQYGLDLELISLKDDYRGEIVSLNKAIQTFKTTAKTTMVLADMRKNLIDFTAQSAKDTITGVAFTPFIGLANAVSVSGVALQVAARLGALATEQIADALEISKQERTLSLEINIDEAAMTFELREKLKEIEQHLRNEVGQRYGLFMQLQALREISDRYRGTLERGFALLDAREDFNKQAAGSTQKVRYQDMAFRTFRNDALSKYRDSFDLAARYAYLAAKAYDYDTNLSPDDPFSALGLLDDIAKARTLGTWSDGEPLPGGGLAGALTVMRDNYAVHRTQLGLNNTQREASKFSLRQGHFRNKKNDSAGTPGAAISDASWKQVLQDGRKANLWEIPEFRQYCRPPQPESAGAIPGLVIDFPTEIIFGRNVFGWPLGGGDFAYDPTNFATKIRAAGIWFEGYDNAALAVSPRVYLVPVGVDVMTIPNSTNLQTREWNIVDQSIPPPFLTGDADLRNPDFIPSVHSLNGPFAKIRKYSSFRAYGDTAGTPPDEDQMTFDSRLIGRSVWNTKWLLIIPGGTLSADGDAGLDQFIADVSDIKLFFNTIGYSGN